MHDPKFEKEVQQKMEELEFSPSEAVWTKLERDLRKEKRNPLPLFWLFFLVGGILLGAGGTWLFFAHDDRSASPPSGISQNAVSPPSGVSSPVAGSTVPGASSPAAIASSPAGVTQRSRVLIQPAVAAYPALSGHVPDGSAGSIHAPGAANSRRLGIPQDLASLSETRQSESVLPSETLPVSSETFPGRSAIRYLPSQIRPGFEENFASGISTIDPDAPNAMNRMEQDSRHFPATPLANSLAAKKARLHRAPVWEAGFTGGAGFSAVNQGLFRQSTNAQNSLVAAASPSAAYLFNNNAMAQAMNNYSPKIQPDLSFWAGIFLQKPVLKRLSLSVGLNLHYYSTRVTTGQKVANNPSGPSNSLFYPSVTLAAASRSYPYYPTGDSYSYLNRYYSLELPVSLQWQVNRGRRMPLFWEGGLAVTRLMSVNALYYDRSSGVYYKYGAQSNPIRLSFSTAFMAGLHWRGTRIQLGPELQYGLTRPLNENASNGQHLFYGGIKITVVPGRK